MRVNIIGCAPGWQEAPFDKGERWGINDNHKLVKNLDLIFDCHNLKRVLKGKEQLGVRTVDEVKLHLKAMKKNKIPMFSTTEFKNIPNIKRYPLEDVIRKLKTDYFGCGADYAVAYAIYKGYTEIHLYGILIAIGQEYYHQKPSADHWCGYALGAGIDYKVHDSTKKRYCTIAKTRSQRLYGFRTEQKLPMHVIHELGR